MDKFLSIFLSIGLLCGCATVAENINMVKCKYELLDVQIVDMVQSTLTMDVVIGISNTSKTTAASLKRFEGDLYINENSVSKITLKDVRIEPAQSKSVKSTVEVPISALGRSAVGLVAMGSASIVYEVRGTMYFDSPLGEIPFPVTLYKDNLIRA